MICIAASFRVCCGTFPTPVDLSLSPRLFAAFCSRLVPASDTYPILDLLLVWDFLAPPPTPFTCLLAISCIILSHAPQSLRPPLAVCGDRDPPLPRLPPVRPHPLQSVVAETHQAWHDHRCFGPFAFYDIAGKESNPQGSASIQNNAEAHMVLCVFRELMHRCEGWYGQSRGAHGAVCIHRADAQVRRVMLVEAEAGVRCWAYAGS